MRLIDADELLKHKYHDSNRYENAVACYYICNAPTIDAVEVVRCKDCMFSKVYQNDSSGVMGRFCEAFTQVRMVSDDDFCSYGERKETEHE